MATGICVGIGVGQIGTGLYILNDPEGITTDSKGFEKIPKHL